MAKQDSICLLCGGSPCQCGGGRTKKRPKASVKKVLSQEQKLTNESNPISSSVESDSDTEDVFGEIPTQAKPKFKSQFPSGAVKDLSYFAALRNLRPLVCESDQLKIDQELAGTLPQELDRRLADWKKKHEKQ